MRNYQIAKDHILQAMPGTQAELVRKSGWHQGTVSRWIKVLRAEGAIHIVKWRPPGASGTASAVHGRGPGVDEPCPYKAKTGSQKWQRVKEIHGMEGLRRKRHVREMVKRAKKDGDPIINALFGRT